MKRVYALVDCNSFYANCEKLFRPDLKDKAVIVLSNNDGCVVTRSPEAKALGIAMGAPFFKIRHLVEQHDVAVFSSNYALYADISSRVMRTLETLAPHVDIYSIDEAFLDLSGLQHTTSLPCLGQHIKDTIKRHVGMPVCVGIAPSKTLAKLANHAAKSYPVTGGVVDLTAPERQRRLLKITPVNEIWGIGHRLSARLKNMGIETALDFVQANPKFIRRHFSVVEERIYRELNGESCLALEDTVSPKKQIVCSRSFGERIETLSALREALSNYAFRAAEKLRGEGQRAKMITVFIRTGLFNPQEPHYSNAATLRLITPTDDTRVIVKMTAQLLESLWRPGFRYAKAGIMLGDFVGHDAYQGDLFLPDTESATSEALMAVMDRINVSGKGKIFLASQGIQKTWAMKREQLSPAYTTRWGDLPVVR